MTYDFDQIIDRRGTHSIKWDSGDLLKTFGITERFDEDTIPLFVADMDFPCPQPVVDALHRRVDRRIFGYSAHLQDARYFEAIQGWFHRRHNWSIQRESIVWAPGTVEAIHHAVQAFSKKGEGVIIQQPVYRPFMTVVAGAGRQIVNNQLINEDGYYRIDFEDFERKAKDPNNTLFILCSPHNPVGRVWEPGELEKLAGICLTNGVTLIADEIHGDLVRKERIHHPIQTLVDDDRLIALTAINKSFNVAGLHCTNAVIRSEEMRNVFSKTMGMKLPSPFAIEALIAAYNLSEDWLEQVNEYITANLIYLDGFLKEHLPFVKFRIPEGTYIGWMDFSGSGLTSKEVHQKIFIDANVVLEDGEMFGSGGEGFQRICVPSPRPLIREAMERIAEQFR
jgi:cystathionine beta-lyase